MSPKSALAGLVALSLGSRRQHKAWGEAERNPRTSRHDINKLAKAGDLELRLMRCQRPG
jgi:hypothetical protein